MHRNGIDDDGDVVHVHPSSASGLEDRCPDWSRSGDSRQRGAGAFPVVILPSNAECTTPGAPGLSPGGLCQQEVSEAADGLDGR